MTREMSDGEICRSFAAAKDKNDQIKVLVELNDCGVADIMQVLAAGGMISGLPKPKDKEKLQAAGSQMQHELDSAGRLKWTPELEKEIIKLFEAGLPNGEIAVKLGLNKEQVRTKKARLVRASYLFGAAKAAKTHKDKPEAGAAAALEEMNQPVMQVTPCGVGVMEVLAAIMQSGAVDELQFVLRDGAGAGWRVRFNREER